MFSTGIMRYQYTNDEQADTTELFVGCTFEGTLNPSLILYQDVDSYEGTYAQFGISHTLPMNWNRTDGLEIYAIVGYGSTDYKTGRFMPHSELPGTGGGGDGSGNGGSGHDAPGDMQGSNLSSGLAQFALGLELPVRIGNGILRFNCAYSDFADSNLKSPMFPDDDGQLVWGVSYTMWFPIGH